MRTIPFLLCLSGLTSLSAQTTPATPSGAHPVNEVLRAAGAGPVLHTATMAQQGFRGVARQVTPSVVTIRAYQRVVAAEASSTQITTAKEGATAGTPTAGTPTASTSAAGWVETVEPDYPGFVQYAACSGFVVHESGEVLTCANLIRTADGKLPDLIDIETKDHSRILAEILGTEPTVNLAIVQAMVFPNGHSKKLPAMTFGDSDTLACGDQLLAFGDPAGPEKFCSVGTFITLPERDCYQDYLSAFFQQIAMVAHPEAYGGPVVNLAGEVVGVLAPRQPAPGAANLPKTGIEFALPSKIVVGLYDTIRQVRSFQSPWLGFSVMSRAEIASVRGLEAFEALDKPRTGILIENVFQPSPAWEVGIQPGDFLVGFDTTRIFTPVEFQRCLYLAGIGKKITLELYRAGTLFKQDVLIQLRPPEAAPR